MRTRKERAKRREEEERRRQERERHEAAREFRETAAAEAAAALIVDLVGDRIGDLMTLLKRTRPLLVQDALQKLADRGTASDKAANLDPALATNPALDGGPAAQNMDHLREGVANSTTAAVVVAQVPEEATDSPFCCRGA